MRQVLQLIALTDHRIQSRQMLGVAVSTINTVLWIILALELLYDLQSLHGAVLGAATVGGLIIGGIYWMYNAKASLIGNALTFLVYATIEGHLFINPKVLVNIIYWLPFVPLVAIVTRGLRAAYWWIVIIILTHFVNIGYLYETLGKSYALQVRTFSYGISGILFLFAFFSGIFLLYKLLGDAYAAAERKNCELEALKNQISESKKELEYYQVQLISITRCPSLFEQSADTFYGHICQIVRNTLHISRVSIWYLDADEEQLECHYLSDASQSAGKGTILARKDFAPYFDALLASPYIAASDARTHRATACFNESYLEPLNIYSMLDCPILAEGKPVGVICCEQQHTCKEWQIQDILFIQSLADLIALYQKNRRIKELLKEISRQHLSLVEKNKEVQTVNEELNALNEELKTMNEVLEQRVEERTRRLEIQNRQLRDYAFINSHVLRAPLARIRGLLYLMTHDPQAVHDKELIEKLIAEADELNAISTKMSDILYDEGNLVREDILRILTEIPKRKAQ